jgi:hypothetical protein
LLGGRHGNARHRWEGLLDDVRVASTAIAADQLLAASRRNGPPPREVPLEQVLGRWTFDSAQARGRDASGHGRDLTAAAAAASASADDAPLIDFCHVLLNSNEFLYVD